MGSGPFSSQMGQITASEWTTYLQHFVPYENQLLQYAMDPTVPQQAMTTAQGTMVAQQGQAEGIGLRELQQHDTALTPEEKAAQDRASQITGQSAQVDTMNKARDVAIGQQMGIMGTPLTGITGTR
jgi:hypothetical protein